MSESISKLTGFTRRQPSPRRQRSQPVQKVGQKKAKKQLPGTTMALTRLNHSINSASNPSGGQQPKSGAILPTAVRPPIPKERGKMAPVNSNAVKMKTVRVLKQSKPNTRMRSRKTRLKPMARTLLYGLRLLIVGIGMGAIVGTLLSVLDPANRIPASNHNLGQSQSQATPEPPAATYSLYLSQEIIPLKNTVQTLAAENPDLIPGVFLVDIDTGYYVDVNSTASFPAASTIKLPILIAFFQDVDAGKIRLDEMLTMQQDMIAGGSGNLQYKPVGTKYTAMEVATKMITISDNTATNMLIARLGGIESLNERFRTWGLATTMIRSLLPDLSGTNTTSPRELGSLIAMVNQGNFVSIRSREIILDIMHRAEGDKLLPSGLGAGAKIYHKTGDIGTMLGDAGLINTANGKHYIAAVMVQRPNNDPRAAKLISSISHAAYQQLAQGTVTPSNVTGTLPAPIYQSPIVNPALPNGIVNNIPITSYPPVVPPPPSNLGNTMPITSYPDYQYPVTNSQPAPPR